MATKSFSPNREADLTQSKARDPDVAEEKYENSGLSHESRKSSSTDRRTWTQAEEERLRVMRDAGNSWSEIA